MREIKKYVCEFCHFVFDNYAEASICEKNHISKENISINSFQYKENLRLPKIVVLKINDHLYNYHLKINNEFLE
jgi:hypothetical protein